MDASLVQEFLALPTHEARRAWVERHRAVGEELIWGLKEASASHYHTDPERSVVIADRAREVAVILGIPWLQGVAHWITANAYVMLSQYEDAFRHFRQARTLLEAAGKKRELGQMLVGQVFTLAYLGEFEEALVAAQEARGLLVMDRDTYRLGLLAMNEGVVYDRMERYADALAAYQDAEARFQDLDDAFNQARAVLNQGIAYEHLAALDAAEDAYRHAQKVFRQARAPLEEGRAALNLGILLGREGRFREAMAAFDEARSFLQTLHAAVELADVDLYESQMLLQLHLFAEASDMAAQARTVLEAQGQRQEAALAAWVQGRALMAMGRMRKAHQVLQEALAQFHDLGLTQHSLRVHLTLAELARKQGDLVTALQDARDITRKLETWPVSDDHVLANLLLGRGHMALGRYQEAEKALSQALAIAQSLDHDDFQVLALDALARLALDSGDVARARATWDTAMSHFQRWLRRIPGSAYRAAYIMARLSVIQRALHVRLLQEDIDAAVALLIQIEHLSLGEFLVAPSMPPEQRERWREMEARLQALKRAWQWRMSQNDDDREAQRGLHARTAIRSLEVRIDALWRRMNRFAETWGQPHTSGANSARRHANALTILYLPADGVLWGIALSPEGERFACPLGGMEDLHRLLRQWQLHLHQVSALPSDYLDAHNQVFLQTAQRRLQTFYQRYLAPFRPWIQAADAIQFVPYGSTQGIPFAALYDGRQYLVQNHIPYLAFGMTTLYQESKAYDNALSFIGAYSQSGQLPYVGYEAQQVASVLPQPEIVSEEAFTVETARALMARARFIHLATHARFRDDNPLFSWLQLADGRLTAHDLEGVSLHAKLVVLSACETGRGAGGMMGLPQAFLNAGARALIVSQWQVHDSATGEFMVSLYRHPRLLLQPEIALADAMRGILAADPQRHPYFWAPFMLIQR